DCSIPSRFEWREAMRKKRHTFNVGPLLLPSLLTVLTLSDGCSGSPTRSSPPPPGGQFGISGVYDLVSHSHKTFFLTDHCKLLKLVSFSQTQHEFYSTGAHSNGTATMLPFEVNSATGADEQNARYKRQFVQKPETS